MKSLSHEFKDLEPDSEDSWSMHLLLLVPAFVFSYLAFRVRRNKFVTGCEENSTKCAGDDQDRGDSGQFYPEDGVVDTACTAKRLKESDLVLNSTQGDNFDKDCISQLPDEILSFILQHLTERDAVQTGILSRRWRYLCASRSKLCFNSSTMFPQFDMHHRRCQEYEREFVIAVNQFLQQHKGPNISSFRLSFCLGREFASDVDRWIAYALRMDVQELVLCCQCINEAEFFLPFFCLPKLYTLSFQLLSGASKLKYLELTSCILKPDFKGQFHSLKILNLCLVPLDQSLLLDILSGCLNLEEMGVDRCPCPPVLSFHGPFLRLKHLAVSLCDVLEKIELSATNLTTFDVDNRTDEVNVVFSNVPKLENVTWRLFGFHHSFSKLPDAVPQLQSLSVGCDHKLINSMPSRWSTFGNLKLLEFFVNSRTLSYDIEKIIPILNACPFLQKLQFTTRLESSGLVRYEERTMKEPQKFSYPQLKIVEIGGFYGTVTQLELAIYLLKNAVALERMVVSSRYKYKVANGECRYGEMDPLDEEKRGWIREQLQGKATSENAEVIVQ